MRADNGYQPSPPRMKRYMWINQEPQFFKGWNSGSSSSSRGPSPVVPTKGPSLMCLKYAIPLAAITAMTATGGYIINRYASNLGLNKHSKPCEKHGNTTESAQPDKTIPNKPTATPIVIPNVTGPNHIKNKLS